MYVVLVPLFLLTGATCDDARRHLAIATVAAGAGRRRACARAAPQEPEREN